MGAAGGPRATVEALGAYAGLGGRAMTSTAWEVDPLCHPPSAANKLVIAPGLLTGTTAAVSGRHLGVAAARGVHEGRTSNEVLQVRIRLLLQQEPDEIQLALAACPLQRGPAAPIYRSAGADQHLGDFPVALLRGDAQGSVTRRRGAVEGRASGQEVLHQLTRASAHRRDECVLALAVGRARVGVRPAPSLLPSSS